METGDRDTRDKISNNNNKNNYYYYDDDDDDYYYYKRDTKIFTDSQRHSDRLTVGISKELREKNVCTVPVACCAGHPEERGFSHR